MIPTGIIRTGFLLALAAILLLAGIVVDIAFTRPALRDVERLENRREELLERGMRAIDDDRIHEEMAERFGLEDLADLLSEVPQEDPLSYLGRTIEESGLTRLDIASGEVSAGRGVRRSRFTLRLVGSYSSLLGFVRTLEQGRRLASVDDLEIETLLESSRLESKLRISIYDPVMEQER